MTTLREMTDKVIAEKEAKQKVKLTERLEKQQIYENEIFNKFIKCAKLGCKEEAEKGKSFWHYPIIDSYSLISKIREWVEDSNNGWAIENDIKFSFQRYTTNFEGSTIEDCYAELKW